MIAQGLAWHHWKVLLRPGFSAIASLFTDAGAPFFMQMLSGWNTCIRKSGEWTIHPRACSSDRRSRSHGLAVSDVWWHQVRRRPCRPGPASLAVALTGPDSLIQRLQALTIRPLSSASSDGSATVGS
jgi:hypothetical protein